MTRNFEGEYRSSADGTRRSVSLLYADADEATLEAVARYAERERTDVAVRGTADPDRARDALASRPWSALVLGDGLATSARRRLADAADCPTVLFADGTGDDDSSAAETPADVAVEKGTGAGALSSLFDAVVDIAAPTAAAGPNCEQSVATGEADAVVRDVVRAIGSATSRDELEAAACEHLVELGPVSLAWIGSREGGSDRIVPGTVVGEPREYLGDVVATTTAESAAGGPVHTALETGAPVVVDDFRTDEMVEQWRDLALSHDIYAVAMVPITHGETVHGILAAYARRSGAFDAGLVERLSLIGDAVGFAMTAVQHRRLLQRDASIELEFRSGSADAYLAWLASAADCRLETEGVVDLDEATLQYLVVSGADVERVVAAAADSEDVSDTRVVRDDDDGGVVELRTPTSLQTQLSDVGARLRVAEVTPSAATVVVEAPVDADVRAIDEVVRRNCPGAELVTKTEADPSPDDAAGAAAAENLTDRQREVLQAAYLAGYYAWPRDTTAEELADSLDIASPTLHQHLRRAERNVLSAMFDE